MNYSDFLPETLKRGVTSDAPLPMRMMLASGQLPLGFVDRMSVLGALQDDPDEGVRDAVAASWQGLETDYMVKALTDRGLTEGHIDLIAAHLGGDFKVVLTLLAHQNVGAATLERFADTENAEYLDRISGNQRVLVSHPELIRRLLRNPALDHSVAGRLASLIGETFAPPEAAEAAEAAEEGGEASQIPDVLAEIGFEGELPEVFSSEIPEELLQDVEGQEINLAAVTESTNIYKLIQGLSIAEKIKLATIGSKSARKLLSRDSNRIVVNAVIRSPKIREDEVVPLAQDRTTPDDVLVYILTRKDWMKNYQIKIALCKNPKTPLPKSLRMLESLPEKELRSLSKNKNIPSIVASTALRILSRKGHH